MKGMMNAAVNMKAGHAQTDPADMQCATVTGRSSQDENVFFLTSYPQDFS